MGGYTIDGSVDPAFSEVKNVFESFFASGWEQDAQCCVYRGSEKVVDLWGSKQGSRNEGFYDGDTMQVREKLYVLNLTVYKPISAIIN